MLAYSMMRKTSKLCILLSIVLLSSACTGASRHRPDISKLLKAGRQLRPQPDTPKHARVAGAKASRTGRSLKQFNFDPYGYGYYDPYVAGVTPGFVNVDINRETGLYVGVGDVAVDVSADKNFVGVGVGNLVGVGAARDRGWNLQLAGGNVLDASVTRDAGLGLWVLDGLVNVNIGPDAFFGGNRIPENVAAMSGGAASQAPVEITSVTVDDVPVETPAAAADLRQQQQVVYPGATPAAGDAQVQDVVVDSLDPAAMIAQQQQQQQQHNLHPDYAFTSTTEINPPITSTDGSEVNQIYLQNNGYSEYTTDSAAAAAAPAASPPAELQLPSYDFMDLLQYDESADGQAGESMSAARLPAPLQQAAGDDTTAAAASSEPAVYSTAGAESSGQSLLVARPAAVAAVTEEPEDAEWSVASQYSDTQQMSAARLAAADAAAGHPALQPQQAAVLPTASAGSSSSSDSAGASRRACEGGVQLWTSGTKFKCKYKEAPTPASAAAAAGPVKVGAHQYTYANGVAV